MRNADGARDHAGIMDVLAGAAGTLAVGRFAMIVELKGDPDDVIALRLEQRRGHRGVDAAGHGDDDPGVLRTAFDIETVEHRCFCHGGTAPWAASRYPLLYVRPTRAQCRRPPIWPLASPPQGRPPPPSWDRAGF